MPHSIFILKITVQLQYREERWFEGNTESSQLQGNFLCGTCSSSSKMAAQSLTTEPTFLVRKNCMSYYEKEDLIPMGGELRSFGMENKAFLSRVQHFFSRSQTTLFVLENMGFLHNLGNGRNQLQLNGQHAQLRGHWTGSNQAAVLYIIAHT